MKVMSYLQYADYLRWRERYEKEADSKWITLKPSEDASGGAKVKIDNDGNILARPDALGEKGIHNLKDFGDDEAQDRNRQKLAKGHRKIKREARQQKDRLSNQDRLQDAVDDVMDEYPHLDEKALHDEIESVWKETSERLAERENAKAYARKLSGMTAGQIAAAENRGIDHEDMGKFDTVARDLIESYPDLQGEFGGHDGPPKVWAFIREGKQPIPPKHDVEIVRQAAERLNAAALDFGPMPDESMPFSKCGEVHKYAGFYAWQKRYAKEKEEGERWITLNGGSGDDGHGGTPVKIDGNGNIVAGPKGLHDKGIEHVDHFADKGKRKKSAAKTKASGENKPAPTQVSSPSQQEPPTAKQERKSENSKKNRAVEIEKDDEGNSRGVITLPNGEKFNGKWREGQFSEQDLTELAFKDFVNKQNIDLGQINHGSSADYGESARKMKHHINEVANSVFTRPEGRPEHVAEYVGFSGDTRKYRIQPKWDNVSGLHWVGVYDNDAQGMKSYEITPKHESYDDAASDLGQHFDNLRGKGDLKIHDDVSQKAVNQREESRTKKAQEEEEKAAKQRAEEAETNRANQEAKEFIDSQLSGVKGSKKSYNLNMSNGSSTSVSGTVYGPFGVHKDDREYTVTHLGSGISIGSYKTAADAKTAAILTGKHGKWDFSDPKSMDKDTSRFGLTIAKALKSGDLRKIKQAFDDNNGGKQSYSRSLSPEIHAGYLAWKERLYPIS